MAFLLEQTEFQLSGGRWLDALVLAILLGAVWRHLRPPEIHHDEGIRFVAKPVMEFAIALLGASMSLRTVASAGAPLIGGIALCVVVTLLAGYWLGRWLGLSQNMAMLIACGNAICGNSAIAAVAPAIEAKGDEVAASIGFTAALGIAVVVAVPVLAKALHLDQAHGGILAGLMVYAVPQVVAAANPLGPWAVQVAAIVKLVRVLMLGPVVAAISFRRVKTIEVERGAAALVPTVPRFILVFLALAALRTWGVVPDGVALFAQRASFCLTVCSMAALGLGVELGMVARAGWRAMVAASGSLFCLTVAAIVMACLR